MRRYIPVLYQWSSHSQLMSYEYDDGGNNIESHTKINIIDERMIAFCRMLKNENKKLNLHLFFVSVNHKSKGGGRKI